MLAGIITCGQQSHGKTSSFALPGIQVIPHEDKTEGTTEPDLQGKLADLLSHQDPIRVPSLVVSQSTKFTNIMPTFKRQLSSNALLKCLYQKIFQRAKSKEQSAKASRYDFARIPLSLNISPLSRHYVDNHYIL